MKYIQFKYRGFFIFEESQSHDEIAKMVDDEVISAGFVKSYNGTRLSTYGESVSLLVQSKKDDARMINMKFDLDDPIKFS